MFYNIPFINGLNIETGALLEYYGTALGIIGSFVTYRYETKKKKMERNHELKPKLLVELEKSTKLPDVFNVKIMELPDSTLSYFYLYDEFISVAMKKETLINLSYNKSIEEIKQIKTGKEFYNITMDPDIIDDKDHFPKYVQILCDDTDNNTWNCCFDKVNDCGRIYYYPSNFELV